MVSWCLPKYAVLVNIARCVNRTTFELNLLQKCKWCSRPLIQATSAFLFKILPTSHWIKYHIHLTFVLNNAPELYTATSNKRSQDGKRIRTNLDFLPPCYSKVDRVHLPLKAITTIYSCSTTITLRNKSLWTSHTQSSKGDQPKLVKKPNRRGIYN